MDSFLPLSASRLKSYLNCPKAFRYRYKDRLPEAFLSIEAFAGRLVHEIISEISLRGREGERPPRLMAVLEELQRRWADGLRKGQSIRVVRRDHPRKYLARASRALENYYWANRPFKPVGEEVYEKEILFELVDDVSVRGFIDKLVVRPNGDVEIHDYKTGMRRAKKMLPRGLGGDLQSGLYSLGLSTIFPKATITCHWHFLLYKEEVRAEVTQDQTNEVKERALELLKEIRSSTWKASPTVLCHWCGFNDRCQEGKRWMEKRAL
ncbi:PD-(D/E)XK nuclease family protein [bacterium]|nr:PD-(D/E)XK nuclease family protein [bacterium]